MKWMAEQEAPFVDVSINLGMAEGLSDEELTKCLSQRLSREEISAVVDKSLEEFDQHFQVELNNDPLTKGEKAVIKTFLLYQLVFKHEQAAGATV